MSAAKHTPGPWRFGKRSDDVVADVNAGHRDDQDSLEFYGGHLVAESIARRADKALIAAAPELLDALKRLVAQSARLRLPGQPMSDAEKAADAAIAKAEGGAS